MLINDIFSLVVLQKSVCAVWNTSRGCRWWVGPLVSMGGV